MPDAIRHRGLLDRATKGGPRIVTTWTGTRIPVANECILGDLVTGDRVIATVERRSGWPPKVVTRLERDDG